MLLCGVLGGLLMGCPTPCECPDDDVSGDDDTIPDDDSTGDDDASGDDDTSAGDDDTTVDPTQDADGDGFTLGEGDCDDTDPEVNPGAQESCGNEVDDDCDGIVDYGCQIHIPEGEFQMGAADDVGASDQKPMHAVWLDAYYIDKYEVSIRFYKACHDEGVCNAPRFNSSYQRDHYYDDPTYLDYPVIYIQREDARTYCDWVGGTLPTEAQWEKAARGDQDERLYPWGDWYDCSFGNANWCIGETVRVGSYPRNLSPYGVADMAGNVWEFFNDYYAPNYYVASPYENPTGPPNGDKLSYRGGAFTWWGNPTVSVRHPARELGSSFYNIGFRCAYDEAS